MVSIVVMTLTLAWVGKSIIVFSETVTTDTDFLKARVNSISDTEVIEVTPIWPQPKAIRLSIFQAFLGFPSAAEESGQSFTCQTLCQLVLNQTEAKTKSKVSLVDVFELLSKLKIL